MKKILIYLIVATAFITQAYGQIHWRKYSNNMVFPKRSIPLRSQSMVFVVDTAYLILSIGNSDETDTTRRTYSYSGWGQVTAELTEERTLDELGQMRMWENSWRKSYSYDASGNQLTYLFEVWNNSQWENDTRRSYSYDGSGRLVTELYEEWKNGDWANSLRDTYSFDDSKNQIIYQRDEWYNGQWVTKVRSISTNEEGGRVLTRLIEQDYSGHPARGTYTYDENGNLLTWLAEDKINGQWVNVYLHTNTYDLSGHKLSQLNQIWEGSYWQNAALYAYTYGTTGELLTTEFYQNWSEGTERWEYMVRRSYMYDGFGHLMSNLGETWNNGQWLNDNRKSYSYDPSGNMATYIDEYWDEEEQLWKRHRGIGFPTFFDLEDSAGNKYQFLDVYQAKLTWKPIIFQAVKVDFSALPKKYLLSQNYPNPFNPTTKIRYSISQQSFVTLKVYDILGNEVSTLVNEEKPVGTYELTWNAKNLSSGVYFYCLHAGNFVETRKMIFLR